MVYKWKGDGYSFKEPHDFSPTYHIHFSGIKPSNQEDDVGTHILIGCPILTVIEATLNLRLIRRCKVVLAQFLQSLLGRRQERGQPAGKWTQRVVHPGSAS